MPLVYIERFVLAIIAGLVIFLATANPFGLDGQQRVSAIFVLCAVGLLISIYYQKRIAKRLTVALRRIRIVSLTALLISMCWFTVDTAIGPIHKSDKTTTSVPTPAPGTIEQSTYGSNSPAIANNSGQITVSVGSEKDNAVHKKTHAHK